MDLANGPVRTVDLTQCMFGQLDFVPDEMSLKYISYTSLNNNPSDVLPILTCDFLSDGDLLAPYLSRTSITTFNDLKFKIKQRMDIRNVKFTSRSLTDVEGNLEYDSGTVLIGMEFLRYARYIE